MIEKCKIKLVFKSQEPAQLFQTITRQNKAANTGKTQPTQSLQRSGRPKDAYCLTTGLKAAIIQQARLADSPGKAFRNSKIWESIVTPRQQSSPSEYDYCYTFDSADKQGKSKSKSKLALECQGVKARYSQEHKEKTSPTKISRTISQQLSQRSPQRRPITSEYLSQKRTGYVQLERFERKKPFSMNPNHYEDAYMRKLKVQLDFYFKVQFANRLTADLSLSHPSPPRVRVYVGPGNNQFMVQQTLRKRFWLEVATEPKNCGLYWSQDDMENIHEHQKSGNPHKKYQTDGIGLAEGREGGSQKNLYRLFTSKQEESDVQRLIDTQGYQFVYPEVSPCLIITNHMPNNSIFNERKLLLKLLQDYYEKKEGCEPWHVFPKTYLICNPSRTDIHFYTFTVLQNKKKLWLIKPGERANQENQVELLPAAKIMEKLRKTLKDCDEPWSFLLQEYIEKPFLYKGRKFDLHHFILLTSIGGGLRVYWYYQGYVRTSSMHFSLKNLNPLIHFTGDSVQEAGPDYGYYQPANKLTYNDFERYLQTVDPQESHSFQEEIVPQMKKITIDLVLASYKTLDPKRRPNFELIGLDFMLDHQLKVFLTGANTNPSLRTDNGVLGKLVPSVVEQTLWLAFDPFMPPKTHFPPGERLQLGTDPLNSLRFECIFDELENR